MVDQLWPTLDLNDDAPTWGQDVDDKIKAVGSLWAGPTEPATTFPYQRWLDTSASPVIALKIRNIADSAWVTLWSDVMTTGGGGITTARVDARVLVSCAFVSAINATANFDIFVTPPVNNVDIAAIQIVSTAGVAADGSHKFTFQVRNITDGNNLYAAAKDTSAAAITADAAYDLAGTLQNYSNLAAGKVLQLQVAKTGSPTALAGCSVLVFYKVRTA